MPLREQWPWPGRKASPECLAERDFQFDGSYCFARIRTLAEEGSDVPSEWTCTRPAGHAGVHVGHFSSGNVCARWTDADAREG